ncbi:hypothetical protein ABH966_003808 [Lysinibacillus sp. RC46]|uniref:hypothetical protein n=1 Tax=Lysinibacillus sp. RC46 TaxID=3156295 RepID=UPI003512CFE2
MRSSFHRLTGCIRRSRGAFRRLTGSFRRLTGFPSLDGLSVAYGVLTIPFRIPSRLTKKQKQFSIKGELLF